MIKEIQAPNRISKKYDLRHKVFLAGSIEMGKAEDWQRDVIEMFNKYVKEEDHEDVIIFNPRREDWDSSWNQSIDNPKFYAQVTWELDCLDIADSIIMYFAANTTSPISLLELGAFRDHNIIVVCDPLYTKKGNVDIFCDEFSITMADTLKEAVQAIVKFI